MMMRPTSGNLKTWAEWTIDKATTIAAYFYVHRLVVMEVAAIAAVVYGVWQVYIPVAWIVLGAAIWLVARGMEISDAS